MTRPRTQILYKLTSKNGETRETKWKEGTTHQVKWGGRLCTKGCLHAYTHPLLAVMFARAHLAEPKKLTLWKAKGAVHLTDGTQVGCKRLTTIEQMEMPPEPTDTQRRAFAILCALETPAKENKTFRVWAENWLSGEDRSYESAKGCHAAMPTGIMATAIETAMGTRAAIWTTTAIAKRAYKETEGQIDLATLVERAVREF